MRNVLIIVFLLIVVVFVIRLNLFKNIDFSNVFSDMFSSSTFEFGAGTAPTSSITGENGNAKTEILSGIPKGFSKSNLSPYFGEVKIRSVRTNKSEYNSDLTYDEITLSADFKKAKALDISGWILMSNRGNEFIPKAVNILDTQKPIVLGGITLKRNGSVKIFSSQSPMGAGFRLNKCIGYLNNEFSFVPRLPMMCPDINRYDIVRFTGVCQDYIMNLKKCESPQANLPIPYYDSSCFSYLSKINYSGCVESHRNDSDFLSNDWWIWIPRFYDELHDRLLLFDNKGLLVDEYVY